MTLLTPAPPSSRTTVSPGGFALLECVAVCAWLCASGQDSGTVQQHIEELKQKKRELADALFDETAALNFSSDDLLSLLEG